MTTKSILIDAAHREEVRVAVLEGGVLQDFDRETFSIKQLKGNIYQAKVTRVEASLQAAFVDYGSNRHGFLPFADINFAYYQLPESERQRLQEVTKEQSRPESDEDQREIRSDEGDEDNEKTIVTGLYSLDEDAELPSRNIQNLHKRYNIQDVIKPGQMLLVQVTKEERGNKGVSMTTYISLAGKYCVLMANTPNKGGVSKKVDNYRDRKILKSILNEIAAPNDRSIIIRTAGIGRKPDEIKRDYEYLSRLWDNIKSVAGTSSNSPTLIHSKDDIIRRCIRDIYSDGMDEIVIEGKTAFDTAISFAKLLMPGGRHNIKLHDDRIPIFNKYRVEQQIASLYNKQVPLVSGGSIVIDHAEALVAIDVNSGKATRESGVEETAFNTNLEAVKEIARQLRIRDLAGLIVIDFIDMYDQKHKRIIERTLRDNLQNDRARIQIGRISAFGLMEMSRQRLGASFFELITEACRHCEGTGYVRSSEVVTMGILRAIRHASSDKQTGVIYIYTTSQVVAYMMNYKRAEIYAIEKNCGIHIFVHPTDEIPEVGFVLKKRKSLNDDEKRDLEMEVTIGKVNQMGIDRNYLESGEKSEENPVANTHNNSNNRFRNKRRSRYRNNNNQQQQQTEYTDRNVAKPASLLGAISKFLGKSN